MPKVKTKRYYWKGVMVSEKIYNLRLKQQEIGKNLRNVYGTKNLKTNLKIEEKEYRNSKHANLKDEGYKLVNIETIAHQLICKKCKNVLSLLDTTCSIPCGLGTTYYVTCQKCQHSNSVLTDKQHPMEKSGKLTFDSNTTAVIGTVNGGGGMTSLNKLLTVLGVSPMNAATYKCHEKEVAHIVSQLVEESCTRAAQEERQLTIENSEELKKLLPEHLQQNFLFPGVSQHDEENKNISPNDIVRIAGSFDMGWPTKGSGRSYDSLSGTAGIIGRFGKKIISQIILNRKCRLCDLGHPKSDHDCKLNYIGTAKGMEPAAAALLIGESNKILSACKIQLGIFIGDCDSSAIQAARNAVDYEIVKQDDVNHTANTLTSKLFKSVKKFKELNSTTISYLTKCFNYSVAQNKGNVIALANAIRNIAFHVFDLHANCGDWCQYSKNPDTYKHSVIGDGFQDPQLFDFLLEIFDEMADRSCAFAGGVSSNANESFNAMVASKSPKSKLYGTSFSYNLRVGLALLKKNEGEQYVIELLLRCQITPTKRLIAYCVQKDKDSSIRYEKAITAEFKRQRIMLKQKKAELKKKTELREGPTYDSKAFSIDCIYNSIKLASLDHEANRIVVFFDLETGSLSRDCDILQIAAKYQSREFSAYISPNQAISEQSSKVHGLTFTNNRLLAHGKEVIAINLQEALIGLYQFLYRFKRLCVLTAHNCSFDYPRLMSAVEKTFLDKHFQSLVYGFSDTLPIIRKITKVKSAGYNKLENIAAKLKIKGLKSHDALGDVVILSKVITKYKVSNKEIIASAMKWQTAKEKLSVSKKCTSNLKLYQELKSCTSVQTRKKMIACDITVAMIIDAYKEHGFDGLSRLLGADENGKVRVTNNKNVKNKICDYLKSKY